MQLDKFISCTRQKCISAVAQLRNVELAVNDGKSIEFSLRLHVPGGALLLPIKKLFIKR